MAVRFQQPSIGRSPVQLRRRRRFRLKGTMGLRLGGLRQFQTQPLAIPAAAKMRLHSIRFPTQPTERRRLARTGHLFMLPTLTPMAPIRLNTKSLMPMEQLQLQKFRSQSNRPALRLSSTPQFQTNPTPTPTQSMSISLTISVALMEIH